MRLFNSFPVAMVGVVTVLIIATAALALPPSFYEHTVEGNFDGATSIYAIDVDGDGDVDVLGAAVNADDITWWENDGAENFTEHTIEGDFDGARSVYAADVDGDGDMDVLGAAEVADDIAWWENDGTPADGGWTKYTIDGSFDGAYNVYAIDMDSDGDIDVLGAGMNANQIAWWENDGTPNNDNWDKYTIDGNFSMTRSVCAVDVDNDGDIDVLGASSNDSDIAWWKNDGTPNNNDWDKCTIDGSFGMARCVYAADVDNDGYVDVLGAAYSADDISWWKNDGTPEGGDWTEYVIEGNFDGASSVYATDIDGDCDVDILGAAYGDDHITWWENDGTPLNGGWIKHTVDDDFNGAVSVFVADIDNDGNMDILGTAENHDDITWWENMTEPPPVPTFEEHTIKGNFEGATSVFAADFDGDGDMDVLGAAYTADDIVWFENDVAGNWNENPVNVDFDGARCVHAADINGDGDMDVLGAALEDDDIKWWKNDGEGGFSRHSIDDNFDGANSVYAADLDGDGDLDVLGSAEIAHDISWWENDGTPDVGDWTEHAIDADFLDAKSVYAADIDGDGDIDVLGASYDSDDIAWWVNDGTPDEGEWTMHTVEGSFTGAFSVHAADVDGDGNMDVLGGAENDNLAWFENDGTPLNGGWTEHTIGNFVNVKSVYAADVDGDGDIDVLGTAYLADDITWWENNGSGSFTEHTIAGNFWRANSVHACDVDGDGDIDVLGTAYNGNDITWWENTQQPQPEPETWTENTIEGDFFVASSVFATDVDGDGDTDVLGTSANADDITWWENDGSENFTEHTIQGDFDGASSVYASDVDGDGDVDVLGTADAADDITWWENDGNENFTEHTILGTFDGAKSVYATDVDGDGDVDVLGAAEIADDITWFENDGNENFTEHTILGTFDGAKSVYATDVDSDGDTDILGAAGDARDITWWENDGSQTFTEHTIKGDFDGAYSVYATDMDGDGDVDVLGAAFIDDDITWFENDGSQNFTERGIAGMFMNAYSVYATDVDGDDDVDVLGAASSADDITWWENDGSPSIGGWVEHTIDASFDYAVSVYATDVDGDGDVDVLGAAGEAHDITWWANDINPNVSPARFKHAIPRNRWEMVGVPCNVSDGSPGTLFQADFDGNVPSGSNWMISRYDAVTTGYRRYEEANNNGSNGTPEGNPADFTPGLGYWVIQDVVDNAVMDITIAQSTGEVNTSNRFDVQITAPMTIPTRRGLTQVANPFNHTIDWRDARIYNATDDQYLSIFEAAAANWISGYAYVYDGWAESYTNTNFYGITAPYDLDTWQGFWIEQLLASDELHVQFVPQGMLHKAAPDHNPRRPASEVGEWTLNLEISTSDEVYSDPNNRLGVNAFSSDGYDMMDAIEFTPASGSFVHLYFPHEEWFPIADRFTYDYRAADVNNERVWDFEVRSWNLVERELKLIWSDIAEIPEEVDFVLSDSSDMEINLRDEESYSFFTGEERNQYFYFRITSTGNIQASEQPGTIPTEFGLVALYPNPFNSTVRISYSLLRQEQVSLSVYNVLGREVAKLADGRLSAGIYSTTWKADGFASGVYFVRLETEKQKSIKKFILLQ